MNLCTHGVVSLNSIRPKKKWQLCVSPLCSELDVIGKVSGGNTDELFGYLKSKDFKKMRVWVANNMDVESTVIFRSIYDQMNGSVDPNSIPQVVLILADYSYKGSFMADAELNVVACFTEIMSQCNFLDNMGAGNE